MSKHCRHEKLEANDPKAKGVNLRWAMLSESDEVFR